MRQFISALKFVSHAMANKEVRYYLNGVLLESVNQDSIRLVATDGHRLAKIDLSVKEHGIPDNSTLDTTGALVVISPMKL